jgi:hypothetical protein
MQSEGSDGIIAIALIGSLFDEHAMRMFRLWPFGAVAECYRTLVLQVPWNRFAFGSVERNTNGTFVIVIR